MGTWATRPWDNDSAADWFGDLFDETKLADRVEATLRLDPVDSHDEIRAAASVVLLLGHTYVWPIKQIDKHLTLAADQLEQILRLEIYEEAPEIVASIREEIEELRSRIKSPNSTIQASKPLETRWWQFWK
jgi:hypothetical protein